MVNVPVPLLVTPPVPERAEPRVTLLPLAERMELAGKREQQADEAKRKEKRERLRPLYDSFAEKSEKEARQPNAGIDAMNFGLWMYLEGKYGGPTAADVPDGNTLSVCDFRKAYQRRCDEAEYQAAQPLCAAV
jgi:hypothetical protein